jgi:hypothetical protein
LSLEDFGRSDRARAGILNRAIDLAISPVSDQIQWGVSDHWSDPLETLHSNSGDCEGYAIVKYAALLAAGVSKDAVKIVVLRNRLPNEDHAVVAVRIDNQWLILDNRTLTLVRDMGVRRAIPEFVLDDEGVSRFVWSSRESQWTPSCDRCQDLMAESCSTNEAARHLRFGLQFFRAQVPTGAIRGPAGAIASQAAT